MTLSMDAAWSGEADGGFGFFLLSGSILALGFEALVLGISSSPPSASAPFLSFSRLLLLPFVSMGTTGTGTLSIVLPDRAFPLPSLPWVQ